jgi:CrcB protein
LAQLINAPKIFLADVVFNHQTKPMMRVALIAVFGLVGVFARYYMSLAVSKIYPSALPLGTFAINIIGSFIIGVVFVAGIEKGILSEDLRIGLAVGLLGGFTTFSSYAFEAVRLAEQSQLLYSGLYLFGSPIVGFLAAYAGIAIGRHFLGAA